MAELLQVGSLVAILGLTSLEVVLGIDNVVFIAILVGRLDAAQQGRARRISLALAMIMRIAMLGLLLVFQNLAMPPLTVIGHEFTVGQIVMLAGGLFLIGKATFEIHDKLEGATEHVTAGKKQATFGSVIAQSMLINIVFSLDSIITAAAMTREMAVLPRAVVMTLAIVLSTLVMLAFAGAISAFIEKHPTVKVLALSFLLLIGVTLVLEGFHVEVPKGYIYFSMAFSLFVEVLNIRMRRKSEPVKLHQTYVDVPVEAPGGI